VKNSGKRWIRAAIHTSSDIRSTQINVRRATTQRTLRIRTIHLRRGDREVGTVRSIPHRRVLTVLCELVKHTSRDGDGYIPRAWFMRYSVGVGLAFTRDFCIYMRWEMAPAFEVLDAYLVLYQYRIAINLNIMIVPSFCLCSSVVGMGVLFVAQGKLTY